MKNLEIAQLFALMADLLEIGGANPFRIRAYRRASQSLESLPDDVGVVLRGERLRSVPGIGADLADKIAEYLATGRIEEIEEARRAVPPGVVELMQVPGLGPRTAKILLEKAGVTSLEQLEELARTGRLRGLPGIQAKAEANILRGIGIVRAGQSRMPLARALPLARELIEALEGLAGVEQLAVAGSIRRGRATVGDMDLLVTSSQPDVVMDAFTGRPSVASVIGRGHTKASVRLQEGIQVDLRVVAPESFGAALVYFTGSKQHNIRIREMAQRQGLKISEYGVFSEATGQSVAGRTEEEVYRAIGLPWIAPELREDAGEIAAALAGRLPRLLSVEDMRGDLQADPPSTDGSLDVLAHRARARGRAYVVIACRCPTGLAGAVAAEAVLAQLARIREQQPRAGIALLAALECDVLADGALEHPDAVLARFDMVVAAARSRVEQPVAARTRRLAAALAHPHVSVLARAGGRSIDEREPVDVDLDEVFRAAARHGKAVQIDGNLTRLGLGDVEARRAAELGALFAVATDGHTDDDVETELGVALARRAWIGPDRVINCWPFDRLRAWVRASRSSCTSP